MAGSQAQTGQADAQKQQRFGLRDRIGRGVANDSAACRDSVSEVIAIFIPQGMDRPKGDTGAGADGKHIDDELDGRELE